MRKTFLIMTVAIILAGCSSNTGNDATFFPIPCIEEIPEGSESARFSDTHYMLRFYDEDRNCLNNFDNANILLSQYRNASFRDYPLPQDGLYLFDNVGKANGYYDLKGNCVLNFDQIKENIGYEVGKATNFSEGMAFIQSNTLGEQRFVINKKGEVLFETSVMAESPFRNGYAYVYEGSKYGIIDKNGEIVVSPSYDIIPSRTGEGLPQETYCFEGNKGYGIMDFTGKVVIDCISREPMWIDDNGNVVFCSNEYPYNYGLMSKDGKIIVEPKYQSMEQDGTLYRFVDENENVGWCDVKGKIVIPAIERNGEPLPFYGSKYSYMRAKNLADPDGPASAYLFTQKELANGTIIPKKHFFGVHILTPFVNGKAIAWDLTHNVHFILDENKVGISATTSTSAVFFAPLRWDDYENMGKYIANPLDCWDTYW